MFFEDFNFLTQNFLRSGWCKYETDAAFVTSMGCGYSCIVPVVLEECDIPPTLVTLTYIDGTIPGTDLPAKIASSLLRQESDDGQFSLNIRAFNKIFENGYCYMIDAKRENVLAFRPAKYYFEVDENLLEKLKEHRVEVPETLLSDAVGIVNKDSVMWSYDFLNRCRNFVWSLFLLPLYLTLYVLITNSAVLRVATRERKDTVQNDIGFIGASYLIIGIPASFGLILIVMCCMPNLCHLKKHLNRLYIAEQSLNIITSNRIVREQPLKEYFVGIVKSRHIVPVDASMTPEEYADMLIERHLQQTVITLVDNFDSLPDAPYNRHNVKKGKMCICQQLENNL